MGWPVISRPLDEAKHRQANDVVVDEEVMGDENPTMRRFPAALAALPRVSSLNEALIVPLSRQGSHEFGLDCKIRCLLFHLTECEFVATAFVIFVVGRSFRKPSVLRPSNCSDRVLRFDKLRARRPTKKDRRGNRLPLFTHRHSPTQFLVSLV